MALTVTGNPHTIGTEDADFIVATLGRTAKMAGIVLGGGGDDTILVGHGPVFTGFGGSIDDPRYWTKAEATYVDAGPTAPHTSIAIEGDGQTFPTYSIDLARGQAITLDLDFTGDAMFGIGYRIDLMRDGQVVASAAGGPDDVGGEYRFGFDPGFGSSDPYLSYIAADAGEYQIVVSQSGFFGGLTPPFEGATSLLNVSVAGHAARGTATTAPQIVDGGDGDDVVYSGAGADVLNGGAGDDVLNGGAGDDVLNGGAKLFVDTGVGNYAYESPMDLDDAQRWTTTANPLIGGGGPHTSVVSIQPDNPTPEYDYFSITVGAGETITLDVDFASQKGDPLDLFLALYDPNGDGVAYNGGGGRDRGSDASGRDPALTFTATVAGTYVILVGQEPASGIPAGESYLLNVGVTGHAVSTEPLDFGQTRDVLTGGAGDDILLADGGTVDYSDAAAGVTVTLHQTGVQDTVGAGSDLIVGATGLVGSAFADQLSIGAPVKGEMGFLSGGDGDDMLTGSSTADTLVGGAGYDTMIGGGGSDTYYVDSDEDVVIETARGGTDTVIAGVAVTLADNVENLILDLGATSGTGNALNNTMLGSFLADSLSGLDGNDVLRGDSGDDALQGGRGDDVIFGDGGTDVMTGGSGADRFAFAAIEDTTTDRNTSDLIRDFSHADGDRINLKAIDADASTPTDDAFTYIGSGAFTGVAGQLHAVSNGAFTFIEGDVNGDGTADFVIAVANAPTLVASDFTL